MRNRRSILLLSVLFVSIASLFITYPIVPVTGEVPWKNQGLEWYYDNLDASDRLKIRQAFDYCVPREEIIEGLHLGFATAIVSPIGVNFVGVYESELRARDYNLDKASELLKDVFDYEYNQYPDGISETIKVTDEPYFNITMVCPTTSSVRSQWAALISFSLNQVGIDAIIKWWSWDVFVPRIFLDPVGTGYDYEHGGYDVVFIGHDTNPDPTYKSYYDKDTFPPSSNFYWIEDGPTTSISSFNSSDNSTEL